MRKFILRVVGAAYILVALYGLAPGASGQFLSTDKSYNIFLGIMGLMALGSADLGGDYGKWFDFTFSLLLIVLTVAGAINFLYYGSGTLGNILLNGFSAIALLDIGMILNHWLKQELK